MFYLSPRPKNREQAEQQGQCVRLFPSVLLPDNFLTTLEPS